MKTSIRRTTPRILNQIGIPGILLIAGLPNIANAASNSWNTSGGVASKAAYKIGSTVEASASTTAAAVRGDAFADVAFLNSGYYRIAYATATATATKTSLAASARVSFMGATIWSPSKSGSLLSYSNSYPYTPRTRKSPVPAPITVGAVSVTLTPSVSVGFSSSLSANVNTTSQSFTGSLTPVQFDCSAGVTASALLGVVRVKGNVTVCKVTPTLTSTASWKNRTLSSNANVGYSTLGGSIVLEAGKSWLQITPLELMKWPGFSGSTQLFNLNEKF